MSATTWLLLDIAPTQDVNAIRSAFKAQMLALKRAGVHEDVQHIQPLRQAYQEALLWAAGMAQKPPASHVPSMALDAAAGYDVAAICDDDHSEERPYNPQRDREGSREGDPDPIDVGLKPAHLRQQAEAVVAKLLNAERLVHPQRRLRRLWLARRWQQPVAADALQLALGLGLFQVLPTLHGYQPPSPEMAAKLRATKRWLELTLLAAAHYRWWPILPGRQTPASLAAPALWAVLCTVSVDLLLQLMHGGQVREACAALTELLQEPALQALDSRSAWLATCAEHFVRWRDELPPDVLDTLLEAFGLQDLAPGEHPEPAIDALIGLHHQQQRLRLLQRIARGRLAHRFISATVAAALLQPTITLDDRQAVHRALYLRSFFGSATRLQQMREAIRWLELNAPEALHAATPAVLSWWRGPQLTPTGWWPVAAVSAATVGSFLAVAVFEQHVMKAEALVRSPGMQLLVLGVVLAATATGGWLGWWAFVGLSWLRFQWCIRLYPAWRRQDARWAGRLPLFGPWLPRLNIWLSRDLLVLGCLHYAWGLHAGKAWAAYAGWRLLLCWASRGRF